MAAQSAPPEACGKLICIGKNYARHAAEMNSTVPKEPVVFLKPRSALIGHGSSVVLPSMSEDVHHEVELVALIGRRGRDIPVSRALSHVSAYAVGLDMTARDLQGRAKKCGHPWTVAKGFDTFAPLGGFMSSDQVSAVQDLWLTLLVNGAVRQHANTRDMVFTVAELVAWCSLVFTLEPGDCLFTGTPEGVGPVRPGDVLEARCTGLSPLRVTVR